MDKYVVGQCVYYLTEEVTTGIITEVSEDNVRVFWECGDYSPPEIIPVTVAKYYFEVIGIS